MPKTTNKAAKIRQLLKDGVSVASIAKRTKVSPNYVYQIRYKANGKPFKAKKKVSKKPTIRDMVSAARDVGMDVKFDIVPNEPPAAPSALDVQIGGRHYKEMRLQPIQYIVANGLGFLEGSIVKRISRWASLGGKGLEDLQKIKHEVDLLIELEAGDRL